MRKAFDDGIAWGEAKRQLFELVNAELSDARDRYNQLLDSPDHIESILNCGAEKAREAAAPFYDRLRNSVGISALG